MLRSLARLISRSDPMPPRPEQLDALTEHLGFEIAALEASATHFGRTKYWVFLENFLLHSRLLREFLWGKPNRRYADSDVLAQHYASSWPQVRGACPPTLARTKDAIDKQLAHISRQRIDPKTFQDLSTKVIPIRDEIRAGWKHFLQHLGADPRAAVLQSAVVQKCAQLSVPAPP